MFYELIPELQEITYEQLSRDNINIGMITVNELEDSYQELEFSEQTVDACHSTSKNMQNTLMVYDEYTFGILNIIDPKDILKKPDKVAFYIKKYLFLIVDIYDEDKSTMEALTNVLKIQSGKKTTLEKIIYGFFSKLICEDTMELENLEKRIGQMEKRVLKNDLKHFNDELLSMRKNLLLYHNYYEQLVNIGEELIANENDLFEESNLRYFKLFTDRVDRLSQSVQLLRDYVTQVREAYQAQNDYNLNSIMKLFTVVTTIFLPLTLIVGWYGMNFKYMPELSFRYGYFGVILLSLSVVVACILWFRHKKFF